MTSPHLFSKHFFRASFTAFAFAAAVSLAACGKTSEAPTANTATAAPTGQKIRLAYIAKGLQDVYWKSVEKGLRQAEAEAKAAGQNLEVVWDAPTADGDRPGQISMVENYVNQHMDGIILCPLDDNALVAPAEKAHRIGIPLVIVDSTLNYKETVAFVGTDNHHGGELAGEELARLLHDQGSVILMRFNPGSASCADREQGFLDAIKQHPGIQILSSDNYAGPSRDKAFETGTNLLTTYGGKVDGVFTPNESSTGGMLLALQKAGLAGKVKFVGFDGGAANMAGLQAGQINGLVLQNPYQMGYLGVKVMLDHLAGKTVSTNVDTGATLLTKDNLDSAPVKELLSHTVQ
jgi:ribose transport system substrate-binding protein